MNNKVIVLFLSLIVVISLVFVSSGKANAETCKLAPQSIHCLDKMQICCAKSSDCCKNCEKYKDCCNNCGKCCDKCKTDKDNCDSCKKQASDCEKETPKVEIKN